MVTRLAPEIRCLACEQCDKMEEVYLDTLLENLVGEDSLMSVYERSAGLCLPHFRMALARVRDEETFNGLVSSQRVVWERLAGHLAESIRKCDYRFRNEPRGEEAGSWLRGIAALSGARRVPNALLRAISESSLDQAAGE